MAGPVPYRTNPDKYGPSFPPMVYYRDTYGLEHSNDKRCDSTTTDCSDDSATTKSTVKTFNIHNVNHAMQMSTQSKTTNMTPSYHVEQLVTDQVVIQHPRSLLTLTLVMCAAALQLLIFAIICVLYDGCPYFVAPIISVLLFINTLFVLIFLKCRPTRTMLLISSITASLSFVESVFLFLWTAHLINQEDKYIERLGSRPNRIVVSTRIAMYSMHMIFAPIHAVAAALCVFVLYSNLKLLQEGTVTRGYFMSEPQIGHQKILVPIELKQVRDLEMDSDDSNSIGVQTSGTRTQNL